MEAFSGQFALLDINLRPECYTEEIIISSINRADILKLNDGEAKVLSAVCGLDGDSLPEFA